MDITEFMRVATENKKRGYEIFTTDEEGLKSDAAYREMLKWEHRLSTYGPWGRVRFKTFEDYKCINHLNYELDRWGKLRSNAWIEIPYQVKKRFIEYFENVLFFIDEEYGAIKTRCSD